MESTLDKKLKELSSTLMSRLDKAESRIAKDLKKELRNVVASQVKELFDHALMEYMQNTTPASPSPEVFQGSLDSLNEKMDRLMRQNDSLWKDLDGIKQSQDFICEKYEKQQQKIKDMEKSSSIIQEETQKLAALLKIKGKDLDNLDQLLRNDCLEFHGVPVSKNENIVQTLTDIGAKLDIKIQANDISQSFRIPTKAQNLPPIILAKFSSPFTRSQFLKSRHKIRKISSSVTEGVNINNLFINENLTRLRRKYFYDARRLCKEYNYKYCWVSNGNILVKKQDDSMPFVIHTSDCLQKIS